MSTKIYNGYRIASTDGARPDPFAVIGDLRPRLTETHRRAGAELLADLAARIHNDGEASDSPPIVDAWMQLNKLTKELADSPYRNGGMDLDFSVSFHTDPADATVLYAMLFTEREDYRETWEATPGVEPWPYWNNCDQPDDVTDEEWDVRRDTWDRVIGWDPPALRGLHWTPVEAMGRVPMPHRVKDVVREIVGDELFGAIYGYGTQSAEDQP